MQHSQSVPSVFKHKAADLVIIVEYGRITVVFCLDGSESTVNDPLLYYTVLHYTQVSFHLQLNSCSYFLFIKIENKKTLSVTYYTAIPHAHTDPWGLNDMSMTRFGENSTRIKQHSALFTLLLWTAHSNACSFKW